MKTRKLGSLEVSEMGFGCMSISANYGPAADRNRGIEIIRTAHEKGVTFFDTAEVYGPYVNEELVGEALAPIRDKVSVASKFGYDNENGGTINSQPKHIRKVVEESLKRLRTDHIDLYYQHRVDPAVPIEDVASTIRDLIQAGESPALRSLGGSAKTTAGGCRPAGPAIRPMTRSCKRPGKQRGSWTGEELGVGFVPWGPVGQGYLTDKIDARMKFDPTMDMRSAFPRFSPENIAANMPIVEFLRQFAKKKKATPAQISLAWLLAQKPWIVPIPGTRSMDHLGENLGAIHFQLTAADLLEIDAALSEIKVHGGRMNEEQMKVVDQTV